MKTELLPRNRKAFKANLHCHTKEIDSGDGLTTPEQIKKLYKSNGYNIVSFTGHDKLKNTDHLNDENFLSLPGFEVMWNDDDSLKIYHFNCYPRHSSAKHEYFPFENCDFSVENINKLIKFYTDRDYLVTYNHPAASFHGALSYETSDFLGLKGVFAVEIYNNIVEKINRTGCADIYYDAMLRNGHKVWAVATDDNHSGWSNLDSPPSSPYSKYMGGFTMIMAKELSQESAMEALEKGDFYSCVGQNGIAPEIYRMYVESGTFYADFSPVKSVYLKNSIWHCPHKLSANDDITHIEFEIDPSWTYIRLEIIDSNGCRALGNPCFLCD